MIWRRCFLDRGLGLLLMLLLINKVFFFFFLSLPSFFSSLPPLHTYTKTLPLPILIPFSSSFFFQGFFKNPKYAWKSAAAWYKRTNRVVRNCGFDLFPSSYDEQTRCILSIVVDRSEVYDIVARHIPCSGACDPTTGGSGGGNPTPPPPPFSQRWRRHPHQPQHPLWNLLVQRQQQMR